MCYKNNKFAFEGNKTKVICGTVLTFKKSFSSSSSSSECSAQSQVLHCKRRNLGCSSDEGSFFHRKLRNQGCGFTRDLIGAVASRWFPHPTLSLASEQTLKDLKRPHGHQRGCEESGFG